MASRSCYTDDERAEVKFWKDCFQGDKSAVCEALESGINPNCLPRGERTSPYPLHQACLGGYVEIVKELICWGAIVDVPISDDKDTPLHYAVQGNKADCVGSLIKHGCKTDVKNKKGKTPLDLAEEKNNFEIVGTIRQSQQNTEPFCLPTYPSIQQLCDLNLGDDDCIKLALALGLKEESLEEMKSSSQSQKLMFLEAKKKSNFNYHGVIKALIELSLWDAVEKLRRDHWYYNSPVSMSAYFGSVKFLDYLVATKQCDPKAYLIDLKGQTVLTYSCIQGHVEFIRHLIEKYDFNPYERLNASKDTLASLSFKNTDLMVYFNTLQASENVDESTKLPQAENTQLTSQGSDEASSCDIDNTTGNDTGGTAAQDNDYTKCLRMLSNELWDVRAHWGNLAIQLEISPGTQDEIEADYVGVNKQFYQMLKKWFQGFKSPDLNNMVTALRSKPVGREDLAEKLEKKIAEGQIKL